MTLQQNVWLTPEDYDRHALSIQERNADILSNLALQYLQDSSAVLDLGSGTGAMLARLCARTAFERVVALDISSQMLERGRNRLRDLVPRVEYVQGDFMTTDVRGPFSLVASNAALHWFDADLDRVFERVASLVRPEGLVAIATAGTCAEVDDFDAEVARALPASVPQAFSRRRVDEQRLRQLAGRQRLQVLDAFLVLRTTPMATSAYATWLKASGVFVGSDVDESPGALAEPLERHFGGSVTLRHCSVFGVFQKLH